MFFAGNVDIFPSSTRVATFLSLKLVLVNGSGINIIIDVGFNVLFWLMYAL